MLIGVREPGRDRPCVAPPGRVDHVDHRQRRNSRAVRQRLRGGEVARHARPEERVDHDPLGAQVGPYLEREAPVADAHLQPRLAAQTQMGARDREYSFVELEDLVSAGGILGEHRPSKRAGCAADVQQLPGAEADEDQPCPAQVVELEVAWVRKIDVGGIHVVLAQQPSAGALRITLDDQLAIAGDDQASGPCHPITVGPVGPRCRYVPARAATFLRVWILGTMRWLILLVVVSLGLAACGSGGSHPRAAAFGSERIGGGCSSSEEGSPGTPAVTTPMTCAVVFENGAQFSCPSGVTATTQARVAATKGCRRIAPIRFPASWRRVLRQIANVRDCLRRHGARVIENVVTAGLPGASLNGVQSSNRRLVGELVSGGTTLSFIGFTVTAPFNGGQAPAGWHMRKHANVAVISQRPQLSIGCAFIK